eukprot:scaffold129373_cov19-Tisochrysis_lutea.AAC.1
MEVVAANPKAPKTQLLQVANRLEALAPAAYGIEQLVLLHHSGLQGCAVQAHPLYGSRSDAAAAVPYAEAERGAGASSSSAGEGAAAAAAAAEAGEAGASAQAGGTQGWVHAGALQGGRLRNLRSLCLYVMPRVALLLDCAQLIPLSQLPNLRSLSLDSPIT